MCFTKYMEVKLVPTLDLSLILVIFPVIGIIDSLIVAALSNTAMLMWCCILEHSNAYVVLHSRTQQCLCGAAFSNTAMFMWMTADKV
ncbi:hypothetical protein QQG55_27780 [Brugia pahangi]